MCCASARPTDEYAYMNRAQIRHAQFATHNLTRTIRHAQFATHNSTHTIRHTQFFKGSQARRLRSRPSIHRHHPPRSVDDVRVHCVACGSNSTKRNEYMYLHMHKSTSMHADSTSMHATRTLSRKLPDIPQLPRAESVRSRRLRPSFRAAC